MYSPFKKSEGRRFSAEAAMPVSRGRLTFPELGVPAVPHGHGMQTVITKQFSSSSQSVRHFSGGNLLQEENLFSTKANFFADSLSGHKNAMERKTSCYNDESHTSSRTDTLARGSNRDKLELVTTGLRERHRSGKEHAYRSQDDKTTKSTDQFQTSTQDEFRFASEIPKEFGRIKLNDEDFMDKSKINFFGTFKSPAIDRRVEIRSEAVPSKRTDFLFPRRPYPTASKMGCIRSKSKNVDISPNKQQTVEVIVEKQVPEVVQVDENLAKVLQQLRDECLTAHNKYREIHGSPPLILNEELNEMAQKWAANLASIRTLQHSNCKLNDDLVGENIAYKWMSDGGEFTGQEVTDNWYSEIDKYDYSVGRSPGTGHFTQVVWKSSLEIGVGMGQASDGSFYVVANYLPPGNIIGRFEENVLKPK